MLNLLVKDFKILFPDHRSLKEKLLSGLLTILIAAFLLIGGIFAFTRAFNALLPVRHGPAALASIYLIIINIVMVVRAMVVIRKLFYSGNDYKVLNVLPVNNVQVVLAKLTLLFLTQYLTGLFLTLPVLIPYGRVIGKSSIYYFSMVFYPVVSFFFEAGIGLLLSYPFKKINEFFKRKPILRIVVTVILSAALCVAFYYFCKIAVLLVAGGQILDEVTIVRMMDIKNYFIPTGFMVELFLLRDPYNSYTLLLIVTGIFILGLVVSSYTYRLYKESDSKIYEKKQKEREPKLRKPITALFIKEFKLLVHKNDSFFPCIGLSLAQPFLAYCAIKGLNEIMSSGAIAIHFDLVVFIPLMDVLILVLFCLFNNQKYTNYIKEEGTSVYVMKFIPISITTQLLMKILIPLIISVTGLIASIIVLFTTFVVTNPLTLAFMFVITLFLLVIMNIASLYEELRSSKQRSRSNLLSNTYSYLLPIIGFGFALLLSHFGLSVLVDLIILLVLSILLGLPIIINVKQKLQNLFKGLESFRFD